MVNFIKLIKPRNVQMLMVLHLASFTKNLTSCKYSRAIQLLSPVNCQDYKQLRVPLMKTLTQMRATFKKHNTTTESNDTALTKLLTEELIYCLSQFVDFGIPLLLHCILE